MLNYCERQAADKSRFLRDTKEHRMTIVHDDGDVFRHIRSNKPGSNNRAFQITTFPGYLTFTGDMGSYTFSRLRDMFEFHRTPWEREAPTIDYDYWAEKCEAVCKNRGIYQFNQKGFEKAAVATFKEHDFPHGMRMDLWREFREDTVEINYESATDAITQVMHFTYHHGGKQYHPFSEFWDYGPFKEVCPNFRWVCWAIAHTIFDYDRGFDRAEAQEFHYNKILKGII